MDRAVRPAKGAAASTLPQSVIVESFNARRATYALFDLARARVAIAHARCGVHVCQWRMEEHDDATTVVVDSCHNAPLKELASVQVGAKKLGPALAARIKCAFGD